MFGPECDTSTYWVHCREDQRMVGVVVVMGLIAGCVDTHCVTRR